MSERERRWSYKIAALTPAQKAQVLYRFIALLDKTERSVRILRRDVYPDAERREKLDKIAFVLRKKMRTIWKTDEYWKPTEEEYTL